MTDKQQGSIMFVISITVALIAILVPVFTYREEINMNKYKIEEIREDRKIAWNKQDKLDQRQADMLVELKELMIEITAR